MKLYVARHGETSWNKENKVLGRSDIPLNVKGMEQACELAIEFKKIDIDRIIVSPLKRARVTGEIVAEAKGISVEIADELIEMDFGIYDGVDRLGEEFQKAKRRFFWRYEEGESYMDVAARVYPFITSLKEKYPNESILLVTHGGILRIINTYFNRIENEDFAKYAVPNCGYLEFEL